MMGLNTKVIDEEDDEYMSKSSIELNHINLDKIKATDIMKIDSDRLAKLDSIYNSAS